MECVRFSHSFFLSTMERQFTTRTLTDLFILFFCLVRDFLEEECCCLDLGVEVCMREKEILLWLDVSRGSQGFYVS